MWDKALTLKLAAQMAKTKKSNQPEPEPSKLKQIRLELTEEQQRKFRIVAARHGMNMSQFARSLALGAIEQAEKEGKLD